MARKRKHKPNSTPARRQRPAPGPLPTPTQPLRRAVGLLPAAALIGLQLGLFAAWGVFAGNRTEFDHGLLDLAPVFVLVSTGLVLGLATLSFILPKRFHHRAVAVFTAAGLLFFVQSNFLAWNYGVFDGEGVQWARHTGKGWLELVLWIGFLTWACIRPRQLVLQSRFICLLLIAVQFGLLAFTSLQQGTGFWRQAGSGSGAPAGVYEYSRNGNVLHVILDAFQTDVFAELVAEEDLTSKLDGFVLYRENMGIAAHTAFAVPALFTGEIYQGNESPSTYYARCIDEKGFPNRLHEAGYRVNLLPRLMMDKGRHDQHYRVPDTFGGNPGFQRQQAAWQLLDVGLFRLVPHSAKKMVYNGGHWRLSSLLATPAAHRSIHQRAFWQDYIGRITPVLDEPAYHFLHIMSPHPPYGIFADGSPSPEPLPLKRENYKHEARYSLRVFMEHLERLKQLGIYQDALIVLQGDHGVNFDPVVEGAAIDLPVGRAPTLLATKLPGQSGPLRISLAPTTIAEVPVTVMDALGINNSFPGTPVNKQTADTMRSRGFFEHIGHDRTVPVLRRYQVDGSVFDPTVWRSLGDLEVAREDASYTWGTIMNFGMEGNAGPYKGHGWCAPSSYAQWSDGHSASLRFAVENPRENIVFILGIRPFIVAGKVDQQRLVMNVNGEHLVTISLTDPATKLNKFIIPGEMVADDIVEVTFGLPDAAIPAELGVSGDQRMLGIAVISVCLFPESMTDEMARRAAADELTGTQRPGRDQ